jgi:hypothetical protein
MSETVVNETPLASATSRMLTGLLLEGGWGWSGLGILAWFPNFILIYPLQPGRSGCAENGLTQRPISGKTFYQNPEGLIKRLSLEV